MADVSSLIPLVSNVVGASALLGRLGVAADGDEGPEAFLTPLAEDFARYFELSVPHTFDRLGLMTRGGDAEFTERVAAWLADSVGAASHGAVAALRDMTDRLGHERTYVKAVFAKDQSPGTTFYVRQRMDGAEALEVLGGQGIDDEGLAKAKAVAKALGKSTAAFAARRVVQGGADRVKLYLTQSLTDGAERVGGRVGRAAEIVGVPPERQRAMQGAIRALEEAGGATLFVAMGFEPAVAPELKLYFESIRGPAALAVCDAMRILTDFAPPPDDETPPLHRMLGVVEGLMGADRIDYLGLSFGPQPVEAAFYFYRDADRGGAP